MQLKGKKVYITGGTGGIGTPLVKLLQAAGAHLTAHDYEKEGDLVANLPSIAAQVTLYMPDILINMAGIVPFGPAETQDYTKILNLNLLAAMRLTQAVLPGMKHRKSGHIVNIASMVGLIPLPHLTGYSASKAGLKAFGDALRRELDPASGITITTIIPRAVQTPANSGLMAKVNAATGTVQDAPEHVAQRIFEAIVRDKKEVRIGWPERAFAILNALVPRVVDAGLAKTRKAGNHALANQ